MTPRYHHDKWARLYGAQIPNGAPVTIIRHYPRRRVLIAYAGRRYLTFLWCIQTRRPA